MRFVAALVGILVAVPPFIFFWIGAQTFVRPAERLLAITMTADTGALLVLSIALLFTASVQRPQGVLLVATVAMVAVVVVISRFLK